LTKKRIVKNIKFNINLDYHSGFDNSAPYAIRLHDLTWPTVTHYMLYEQFPGQDVCKIRFASTVDKAYKAATSDHAVERYKWDVVRDDYLFKALKAKFSQHLDLEHKLYKTGKAEIVFVDDDNYLGTGPRGLGHNILGRLIMSVRNRIGKPALSNSLSFQQHQDLIEAEDYVRQYPNNADNLETLASAYMSIGWFERAICTVRFALKIDPLHEDANYVIAKCFIELKQFDKAVEPLKKLVRIDSEDSSYFNLLGDVFKELDKPILSKLYYHRAKKIDE